jgi:hypothetical protein
MINNNKSLVLFLMNPEEDVYFFEQGEHLYYIINQKVNKKRKKSGLWF